MAKYFGQEFFSCGPMWYLLALMVGWVLLDVILNIFPERYVPWAVAASSPAKTLGGRGSSSRCFFLARKPI